MKITRDQAEQIEQQHNVYVDVDSMSYTHGEREDTYGWWPIPQVWIDECVDNDNTEINFDNY